MDLEPQLLVLYYNKVCRIVEESMDAALIVCNSSLDKFTVSKLFDVFDQTFPTAFVLSTGYWIFYVNKNGAPLCACSRFGIICRHVRNKYHWIDLQLMPENNGDTIFNPKIHGPVVPSHYDIRVSYLYHSVGYVFNIFVELEYAQHGKKKYPVNIQASYGYSLQCYGPPYLIRFTPNPILKEQYGKYFNLLRNHRSIFLAKYGFQDLILTQTNMPSFCLLLLSVNVAKYVFPSNISAILLSDWIPPSNISSKEVSTQTENDELEQYKNLLEEVSNTIWKYQENIGLKLPFQDEIEMKSDYPVGINDSEEYDLQFPDLNNKKIIKKNSIIPSSIPKPISTPFIQDSIKIEKEGNPLPHFDETFRNFDHQIEESPIKRRRGRPKIVQTDITGSYSSITKSKKSLNDTTKDLNRDNIKSKLQNQSQDILSENRNLLYEDFNLELDLIDQFIKEDSQKSSSSGYVEKMVH